MGLRVKTDQVRSQQPAQKLSLPRANPKRLRIRPGNMPEDGDPSVRACFLDHLRKQREVVVLNEQQRVLTAFHLFQHGVCELAVCVLIALPIRGTKRRTRMRDVAQGPEPLVRKSVVIAFLFLRAQPHAPQRVFRLVGRYDQAIVRINCFAIRISRSVRDPSSVAGSQDRFERRHQSAGGNKRLDGLAAPHMHIRFAIRDNEERTHQLALDAGAQPLWCPQRLARLAQTGLFFGGGPRFRQTTREVHHLL